MRKRVGIARAIALRPKYMLYDEPTTGLDPVTSAVIDQLMVRMREQLGVTGIVITHDMRSAYTVGTRDRDALRRPGAAGGHRRRDQAHDRSGRPSVHRGQAEPRQRRGAGTPDGRAPHRGGRGRSTVGRRAARDPVTRTPAPHPADSRRPRGAVRGAAGDRRLCATRTNAGALKTAFPRRRARVLVTRSVDDFQAAFKSELVDAAVVDVGSAQEETWRVARSRASTRASPFFGLAALRAAEGPALAQCAAYEFADVLVDGVDDAARETSCAAQRFSARFARALDRAAARAWRSTRRSRCSAWRFIVVARRASGAHVGARRSAGVTREHLSRIVRRRRRAEPQAHHRSRAHHRSGRAVEEPRLRSARRRQHARLRVVVAPVEHGAARRRHEAGVAHAAAHGRFDRAVHQRTRHGVAAKRASGLPAASPVQVASAVARGTRGSRRAVA